MARGDPPEHLEHVPIVLWAQIFRILLWVPMPLALTEEGFPVATSPKECCSMFAESLKERTHLMLLSVFFRDIVSDFVPSSKVVMLPQGVTTPTVLRKFLERVTRVSAVHKVVSSVGDLSVATLALMEEHFLRYSALNEFHFSGTFEVVGNGQQTAVFDRALTLVRRLVENNFTALVSFSWSLSSGCLDVIYVVRALPNLKHLKLSFFSARDAESLISTYRAGEWRSLEKMMLSFNLPFGVQSRLLAVLAKDKLECLKNLGVYGRIEISSLSRYLKRTTLLSCLSVTAMCDSNSEDSEEDSDPSHRVLPGLSTLSTLYGTVGVLALCLKTSFPRLSVVFLRSASGAQLNASTRALRGVVRDVKRSSNMLIEGKRTVWPAISEVRLFDISSIQLARAVGPKEVDELGTCIEALAAKKIVLKTCDGIQVLHVTESRGKGA